MRFGWRLTATGASLSILILSVSAGCSESASKAPREGEAAGVATQAIQGGTDDGPAHPYAVGVCSGNKGNCSGFCSGTLILPNLVVTARHCVDPTPKKEVDCALNEQFNVAQRHTLMYITTAPTMGSPGAQTWHHVKSVVTPTDTHICGNDIALLILDDLVDIADAKPATPGVQYPMGDLNRYVRRFTAIGYGNTGPEGFSAGTRRIRPNISVLCIPGDDFAPCPAGVEENEFIGGDGTCSGDSGSGAFEDKSVPKNAPISFGVLSRGGDNAVDGGVATFCKGSVYTRLDKWRDLVIQAAESASANWTTYPKPVPDWTLYVPPPPDAGVDAGPKKKSNLGEGIACDENDECKSKVCADTGGGKACTYACDEAAPECQAGYVCKNSICVQDLEVPGSSGETPAAAAPGSTTTTSGCAAAPVRPDGAPWYPYAALGILGSTLALRRRRR